MSQRVTPRSEDYSRWYTDVVQKAELADYSPVRGSMVIRPYGYTLWEHMQEAMDDMFKETGHQNAYFPLLIPYSFLQKEAEHVEGFSPELAIVTHGGGKELEDPLVVRPTSETIINAMFAKWIKSYRDLPLLINQWANVVRWEMRTRLFLRTTEFLWQEGHTAHETEEEARDEARLMLEVYARFAEEWAATPVILGTKTEAEKFAGAVESFSIEAMMGDLRALQAGTSHYLGQNFARAFGTRFLDRNNELQYPHQTSWGASTRLVGMTVMVHGDDQGLILPPKLAPYQAVVVPIGDAGDVMDTAWEVTGAFHDQGIRATMDDREGLTPGFKFNDWEMKGVPVRVEIGPRDLVQGSVVLARRDVPGDRRSVPIEGAGIAVSELLGTVQQSLFDRATAFRDEHTSYPATFEEMEEGIKEEGGFFHASWCGSPDCEAQVQRRTQATIRNIPFDQPDELSPCVFCGAPGEHSVVFSKAY